MKVFFVTRYGNDTDGPDGDDTNYLVLAEDYLIAVAIAEETFQTGPGSS